MKRSLAIAALCLLTLAAGFFAQSGGQTAGRVTRVRDIRFDGLVNTRPEEVKNLIPLREGQVYSETALNDSIKKMFSLDMFRNIRAHVTNAPGAPGENSAFVTFIVEENPFIRYIVYEGNSSISKEDLDKVIGMTESSYLTAAKRNRALAAVQRKYLNEGFIEAIATFRLKVADVRKNIFDLVIRVTENKKIVVEKIVITGNTNLTAGEIKGIMKTKEKFFIFVSGVLKKDEFAQDRENVLTFYQHKGYLDAQINRFEWKIEELGDDRHKAIVVYADVAEGPKYTTGKITITGNAIFSTQELMALVNMKEGEVYDRVKMDLIRYNIFTKYSDTGHVYANVSAVLNKNPTNLVVDTELVITEGPLAHIESATVSGNSKTQTKVIRREFLFEEGELYVQRKVRQTQEKLMQTQFFSDVKVNWLPGSAEGLVNLDIGVEEQRTGMITFGVGYGTESGFNASLQLAEKNLFGTGRMASIRGEWGEKKQSVEIGFQEPWLFDMPLYAGFSLGYSRYKYDNIPADSDGDGLIDGTNFNYIADPTNTIASLVNNYFYFRDTISLGGRVIRQFWVFWSGSLGLSTTFYQDSGSNFTTPLIFTGTWETNTALLDSFAKGWTFKNMLSLGINHDSTSHPLNPLSGVKLGLDQFFVGGILQGDAHFIKTRWSFDTYINPIWKIVLALHLSQDFLFPQFDGRFKYDLSDMLYFDGMYEMRGYYAYPVRAESKLFASTELRFQIFQEIWGTFFYDMGNLWGKYQDWAPWKPDGYLFSFGAGIMINIPMIPIRFYMARRGLYEGGQWQLLGSQEFFENWTPVLAIQGLF